MRATNRVNWTIGPGRKRTNATDCTADGALVQRYRSGDRDAGNEIVKAHQNMVYRIAFGLSGRREDAEELAQEIFLKVFEKLPALRNPNHLRPWIRKIAKNHLCNEIHWRQHTRQIIKHETCPEAKSQLAETTGGPEDLYMALEGEAEMSRALSSLELIHREVLVLSDMEEIGYEEIAELLNVPIGTVRSRLCRARKLLGEALKASKNKTCCRGGR